MTTVIFAILVTFHWSHAAPSTVKEFVLIKETPEQGATEIFRMPASAAQKNYTVAIDIPDTAQAFYTVAAVNNFGTTPNITRAVSSEPLPFRPKAPADLRRRG